MTQGSERDMKAANIGVKMATTSSSTSHSSNDFDPAQFKRRKGSVVTKRKGGRNSNKLKR